MRRPRIKYKNKLSEGFRLPARFGHSSIFSLIVDYSKFRSDRSGQPNQGLNDTSFFAI